MQAPTISTKVEKGESGHVHGDESSVRVELESDLELRKEHGG